MSSPQPQDDPVIRLFLERIGGLRERIAKIVLFGSRARGDNKPWSDYDVLLLVDKRDQLLVDQLYDSVVESRTTCTAIFRSRSSRKPSGSAADT
jgi:hypothetical protein